MSGEKITLDADLYPKIVKGEYDEILTRISDMPMRGLLNVNNFERLLSPHLEDIRKGEIRMIVGDDKSARNPALIVARTINTILRNQGRELIPVVFIDPEHVRNEVVYGGEVKDRAAVTDVVSFIEQHAKNGTGSKMMIVSDYMGGRGSTKSLFTHAAELNHLEPIFINDGNWYRPGLLTIANALRDDPDVNSIHAATDSSFFPTEAREEFEEDRLSARDNANVVIGSLGGRYNPKGKGNHLFQQITNVRSVGIDLPLPTNEIATISDYIKMLQPQHALLLAKLRRRILYVQREMMNTFVDEELVPALEQTA